MAAPRMIQTPRNNSKSCKILENNIFPYSVKVVPGKNKRKHIGNSKDWPSSPRYLNASVGLGKS